MMEVHMLIALIVLIVLAVVVLTGIILSLVAGLRPVPRFNPRLLFPTVPRNDFFWLVRTLTQTDGLWHPGRGDLPDPTAGDGTGEPSVLPPSGMIMPPNIPFQ
jgi:hypothetical protein